MENEILVLGINPFDFDDPKTTKNMKGVTLHYVTNDCTEGRGSIPVKATLGIDQLDRFNQVPGIYKAVYKPVVVNGKLGLKMSTVDLVAGVDLYGFFG